MWVRYTVIGNTGLKPQINLVSDFFFSFSFLLAVLLFKFLGVLLGLLFMVESKQFFVVNCNGFCCDLVLESSKLR
ncbi:hypothetical protein L6452_00883 [Arctium lappa]|uniref:Uncharacterized protein n=1 Tax=Arctium lappa TaxID=4217 RepID=A0ACB9FF66_ARCLA|nr:hypothetical protein L6452_00883 [Arctium lappa]